ncbi:FAD-dependent monooxygenase [Nonomuraea sp. NPDC005501]|uniref:FAD-dependent monooxygenase n=1 Tax=Nonomuraea sp. NPDC005501 TaxID=3156884 RepID=UPI00339F4506
MTTDHGGGRPRADEAYDTGCVVVGGGPGGVVLAYLLARGGARVTLLESHGDFNRRFRGDSIAPAVLDYLHTLGLADEMLETLPHTVAGEFVWRAGGRAYILADYRRASRRHPYYALIPQARFLPFMAEKAAAYPGFELRMGARVGRLLRDGDGGRVNGVAYAEGGVTRELRARVVVAADGRNSKLRGLGGFTATELGAGLDVLWYAVPRTPDDPPVSGLQLVTAPGALLAVLNQDTSWQLGYLIAAGGHGRVRERGVGAVVEAFTRELPWLRDRLFSLTDVNQLTLLPVRITTVDTWYRPGLLLIGDAAHVISPVGGNGINLAIADAAATANALLPCLLDPASPAAALDAACREVEAVRRPPTDREQRSQRRAERAAAARLAKGTTAPPFVFRLFDRVPMLATLNGRQNASLIRVPSPRSEILRA